MKNNKNKILETFTDFYKEMYSKFPNNIAYIYKPDGHTKESNYIEKTYTDLHRDRLILKKFLKDKGYINEKLAISGRNSYMWAISLASVLSSNNVAVPLDKDLQVDELKQSLIRSKVKVLFYDKKYSKVILKATEDLKDLDLYTFNDLEKIISKNSLSLEQLEELDIPEENSSDDLKILLFTSGTTSMSKMVILTSEAVLTNISDILSVQKLYDTDNNLAILPFHHIFGLVGSLLMLASGIRTAFPDGLRYIAQNFKEYRISVFFGVPLLIEGMYHKIIKSAKDKGKLKTLLLMIKISNALRKIGIDVRKKLFQSINDAFGGNLRFIISAAASLDPEVIKFFNNIGILAIQGYGLTETSPVLTAETHDAQMLGSVGKAMEHVELKIDKQALADYYINSLGYSENDSVITEILNGDEGEVLARGPSITKGYYMDPIRTKEAFTLDGWFRTGDIGKFKEDYLFITGRIKDMIVLPNGKKAFPEEMEFLFQDMEGVVEPFIFGSDKNLGFGSAGDTKIYVAIQYDKDFFKNQSEDEINQYFSDKIKILNKTLPRYKYIRAVFLYDRDFIKTSTKKIKRNIEKDNIEKKFSIN